MSAHTEVSNQTAGTVLIYFAREHEPAHEKAVLLELGKRIARLLGMAFGGPYSESIRYTGPLYFIPSATLVGAELTEKLGIRHEGQLFGGAAPHPFIPTKAITHTLLHPEALAPEGWSHEFGERVRDSVLKGITAFTLDDARRAGEELLRDGPIRIKPVHATAGRGQIAVTSTAELINALLGLETSGLEDCGLVIEENLTDVRTFSVGQVRVGGNLASYVGTQCLTQDNHGELVYGGSDLIVARGDFDRLLQLKLAPEFQTAISKARLYDEAAMACFPGLFASRRNYDVAAGKNGAGAERCGVLEQSWRAGGASAAEIVALEAFHTNPHTQAVRSRTIELFGPEVTPPPGAVELYHGIDLEVGLMRKFVTVEPYGY